MMHLKTGGRIPSLTYQSSFHDHKKEHSRFAQLQIAVIHEWWAKFGGSEKLALEIHRSLPSSQLKALYIDKNAGSNFNIEESWFSKIPLHESRIFSVAISPIVYRSFSKGKFDLVISSSHNFAHTVKLKENKNCIYLSYIHTPSRAIWSPAIDNRAPINNSLVLGPLKKLDKRLGRHVKSYAANSSEVANRINTFWNKESTIIHPPVEIYTGSLSHIIGENLPFPSREYLISAGRFVAYKNHDLAIRIAAKTKLPIVIMGSGKLHKKLLHLAMELGVQVYFEIAPDIDRWRYLIAHALCFLFPVHEDFGMTPVESFSLGTPVIALAAGGALDFMKEGINGRLIPELNVDLFSEAIANLSAFDVETLRRTADAYTREVFTYKLYDWISKSI